LACLCLAGPALAEGRVALVIGNAAYRSVAPLAKARADAQGYAQALRSQDYFVQEGYDLDAPAMAQAVANFADSLQSGDTAVFVFAGQGFGEDGVNFLAGVEAPDKARASDLIAASLPLYNGRDGVLDQIADKGAGVMVAIIDASHGAAFHAPAGERFLGVNPAPAPGAVVIYSASEGQIALERIDAADKSPNSLFGRTLPPLLSARRPLAETAAAAREAVSALAAQAKQQQVPAFFIDAKLSEACLSAECRASAPADAPQSSRAAVLMASPAPGAPPIVNPGTVTWSTEPPDPAHGMGVTARADIVIPGLKLHGTMVLARNLTAAWLSSHHFALTLKSEDGSRFPGIKQMAMATMRRNEPPSATPLIGSFAVADTGGGYFFTLSPNALEQNRNLATLRANDWFDFPILLTDGRVAKLTFEKGALGEKFVAETLDDPK
jgi:hypothetical protein